MAIERISLHPQAQGIPIDRCDHLRRHEGVMQQYSPERTGIQGAPLQGQHGFELPFPSRSTSMCTNRSFPGGVNCQSYERSMGMKGDT